MERQISTISISCHKSTRLLQYIHSSNSILILSIILVNRYICNKDNSTKASLCIFFNMSQAIPFVSICGQQKYWYYS